MALPPFSLTLDPLFPTVTPATKNTPAVGTSKPLPGLIDMSILDSNVFENHYNNTVKRSKAETEKTIRDTALTEQANREIATVNDMSRASAELNRKRQLDILSGINQNLEKAKTAMQLTDSQNPLDRLTLWYLQQSDPAYTRDGNLKRVQYLQEMAGTVGVMGALEQENYTDQTQAIAERLELAKLEGNEELMLLTLMEKQGQEQIAAAETLIATQAGMLQNTHVMRNSALAEMPDEAVAAAMDDMVVNGKESVNVAGVEIPKSFIAERLAQIEDRKFLMQSRSHELQNYALANMDMQAIEEAIKQASVDETGVFTTEDGATLSLARLQERRAALKDREFAELSQAAGIVGIQRNEKRESEKRILQTMNPVELNAIAKNGGRWEKEGITFDMDLVNSAYEQAKAAELNADNHTILGMTGEFNAYKPSQYMSYLDSINVPAGNTQLGGLIEQHRSRTRLAASLLNNPNVGEVGKASIYASLDSERAAMDEAITATAKSMSANNKNLATLIEAHIRGQAIPTEIMEMIISEEASKNHSLAPFLGKHNGLFLQTKDALRASLSTTDQGFMQMSKSEQETYLTTMALESVKGAAVSDLTTNIMAQQVYVPGNPLKDKLTPTQVLTMFKKAEESAGQAYAKQQGWDENKYQEMLASGADQGLALAQFSSVMLALDEKYPGLGLEYAKWWASPKANEFVADFVAAETTRQATPQDLALWSLASPAVGPSMQTYGMGMLEAHEFVMADQLAREHVNFVNFGGDPTVKQAFLIQQTPDLTDSEKQTVMAIMMPIIDEAKGMGDMSAAQMSQYIESKLRQVTPPAGDATRIWKKMLAGRDKALNVVDDFLNAQAVRNFLYAPGYGGMARINTGQYDRSIPTEVGSLKWFTDMQKAPE